METEDKPSLGTCVAIISEKFDSSGERKSFERWHGIVQSVEDNGYLIALGGVKQGQNFLIPQSGELKRLPGGHFYFEESDEWVAPLYMYELADHSTN